MKKTALILIFAIALGLAGCGGKPSDVSDGVYNAGIEVVSICDQYLDALIDADKAFDKISDIYENLKNLGEKKGTESSIELRITIIITQLTTIRLRDAFDLESDTDSYSDFLEKRNNLAEKLNQKTRK